MAEYLHIKSSLDGIVHCFSEHRTEDHFDASDCNAVFGVPVVSSRRRKVECGNAGIVNTTCKPRFDDRPPQLLNDGFIDHYRFSV